MQLVERSRSALRLSSRKYGALFPVLISPAEPQAHAFRSELLAPALRLLAETIRRVRVAAGPAPVNAWVHDGPDWRVELLPRLSVLAGVELGAGWWINPLPPEKAADVLRSVSPV